MEQKMRLVTRSDFDGLACAMMLRELGLVDEIKFVHPKDVQDGKVELRRTDIADEISCAPSQISYVLSTRFTQDKGFVVESRRGLGGFIRIVQVPVKNMVYEDMLAAIKPDTELPVVQSMIKYLLQHEMITGREASLMMQFVVSIFQSDSITDKERVRMLKTMLLTLENFS